MCIFDKQNWISLCLAALLFHFCPRSAFSSPSQPDTIPFVANYEVSTLPYSDLFETQKLTGHIHKKGISEASGLVCGRINPGSIFFINDHGNENIVWATDQKGSYITSFLVDGADNRDWEDLVVVNNGRDGSSYIYIPDIGDNHSQYKEIFIYKIAEPQLSSNRKKINHVKVLEKYTLVYPDGPHNAEAFFIDPISNNWYIATKGDSSRVYVASFPQSSGDIIKLHYIGVLPFRYLTAGDISFDGMELLLKNYEEIYYWKKESKDERIDQLLQRKPLKVPYIPEVHGESVGWTYDASGFFTASERRKDNPKVFYFEKRQ